jgi:hypothetical protein
MPDLLPSDHSRVLAGLADKSLYPGNHCSCVLERCPHIRVIDGGKRVLLFVHSRYYVEPLDLARAIVDSGSAYALSVEHVFRDVVGSLSNGSLRYHMGADGLITSIARGQEDHPYHHGPGLWTISGQYQIVAPGDGLGVLLRRSQLVSFGDTHVARYDLIQGSSTVPRPPPGPYYKAAVGADNVVGPDQALVTVLNKNILTPRYEIAVAPVEAAFWVCGAYVLTVPGSGIVPIPRGLIGQLTLLGVGKPRNAALYQMMLARGKRIVQAINMPDDIAVRAVYYAAAAAMTAVEEETVALGRVTALFGPMWSRHARVLGLEAVWQFELDGPTKVAIITSVPSVYVSGAVPAAGHALVSGVGLALLHPFVPLAVAPAVAYAAYRWYLNGTQHHGEEAQMWAHTRDQEALALPTGVPVLAFAETQTFQGHLRAKTTAVELRPGARYSVGRPALARWDRDQQYGLRLQGVGFQALTPSFIPQTEAAAVNALESRVLRQFAAVEQQAAWDTVVRNIDDATRPLNELVQPGEWPDDMETLFEPFVNRFPPAVAAQLRAAHEDLRVNPLNNNDLLCEAIIKREKTGRCDTGGLTLNDARIVICLSPRFNAAVGPACRHDSLQLRARRAWREDAPVVWAITCSAEEIGAWHDYWTAFYRRKGKRVVYGVGDFARFDGHQRKGALFVKLKCMLERGVPVSTCEPIPRVCAVRGVVKNGRHIKFASRDPINPSGIGITTDGNCLIVEVSLDFAFGPPGPDSYAAIILGDDFYTISGEDLFISEAEFGARIAPLGLEATYLATTDTAQVEFVSLIPYPTADGTVFGPKIVRQLHRAGWSTSSEYIDVYGAAVSMANSTSFVPFLRPFFDVHRRLARPEGEHRDYHRLAVLPHDATPETYEFVERRYGLTPEMETHFIELLQGVTSLPALLDWQPIEDLATRDD